MFSIQLSLAQKPKEEAPPPVSYVNGNLKYLPDSKGNRVPDFSYCGYKAGEQIIPDAPVKIVVTLKEGDATQRIQHAIDYVSKLPADGGGIRGAVLLQKGAYTVNGHLLLHTSGVVLRGSGFGKDGTVIIGAGKDRETLVRITGKDDQARLTAVNITDDYVPVNAKKIHISGGRFKTGDQVIVTRPCTKEWIDALGTGHFGGGITSLGWKPGQRTIEWRRTITAVNGNEITLDAPLTTALDKKYGGGTIAVYNWPGRIRNCGIENLQLVSEYDTNNEKDEAHRWMAITINNIDNAFIRRIRFLHFAGSAVAVYEGASKVTVEDCISQHPVSEIGGERRNTFFTSGQQVLFQRCFAEQGMHDFRTGFCTPGPTAFVQCVSQLPYSFSGGIDSWSSGVLFDAVSVDGQAISFMNRGQDGQGAGWNIANSVLWNCSAARIDCYQPPTAQNWAFGSWSQFAGDGYWGESNNHLEPRSLYYTQLKHRLNDPLENRVQVMHLETEASSSPTVAVAAELTKLAYTPAETITEFIEEMVAKHPLHTNATGVKTIDEINIPAKPVPAKAPALQLVNGWLVRGNELVSGNRIGVPWWSGTAKPYALDKASMAVTRFVPGRIGTGWTDDLGETTDTMLAKNIAVLDQNYGLWYERRRDDHERVRRMDGDVWPPFYELPFARSGEGTAWDGLSKYDLTKYNYWYWHRLQQFAGLADQKGLLLFHQNYFQHNIIEAGAHYADFPWRTANNINNTGFPEPVPYAGDKRIFLAEQFYDTTNTHRRELNKKYIRQCLDNFKDNNSVIQFIGEEFTGPLHFVQFWLNTIREWQQQNGKKELIALSTTKDVQDAILADPKYASFVDVIDIKYWYYQGNGAVYAPQGGQNLAPRQHARLLKPKGTSPQQVYRAVLEYKQKFPGKAVLYNADAPDRNGWAVLMAGGSIPNLKLDAAFAAAAATMKPVTAGDNEKQWMLQNELSGYIIYNAEGKSFSVDLSKDKGKFEVIWVNTRSGNLQSSKQTITAGKNTILTSPKEGSWVLWLKKK